MSTQKEAALCARTMSTQRGCMCASGNVYITTHMSRATSTISNKQCEVPAKHQAASSIYRTLMWCMRAIVHLLSCYLFTPHQLVVAEEEEEEYY